MLVVFSFLENLFLAEVEFNIILVSCPVNTTTPYIYSVFLNDAPLNRMLSAESDTSF